MAFISRTLKAIAKELNVPMIALSQLSRATEMRGGSKRPQLSDLRESGAIEQDADIVAFIHRPEYYGINQDENGMPTAGMAEIILAKHRNGAVCDVNLRFLKEQARSPTWRIRCCRPRRRRTASRLTTTMPAVRTACPRPGWVRRWAASST